MKRFDFLSSTGAAAATLSALAAAAPADAAESSGAARAQLRPGQRLVAIAVTAGANVMDVAGPWEVFQDTPLAGRDDDGAFLPFLVSDARDAVAATAGLGMLPRFTFADAPQPDVVVVGAQRGSPGLAAWLQAQAPHALVMSVCTGAFKVAQAGLFDGKRATTHHEFYDAFAKQFPNVTLVRGPRFVDAGNVCSAGGLTSGINLALHVVERFHGREVADRVSSYMEFVRTERPGVIRPA